MEIDIRIFMGINRRRSLDSTLAEQGDAEYIKELMEGIFDAILSEPFTRGILENKVMQITKARTCKTGQTLGDKLRGGCRRSCFLLTGNRHLIGYYVK